MGAKQNYIACMAYIRYLVNDTAFYFISIMAISYGTIALQLRKAEDQKGEGI